MRAFGLALLVMIAACGEDVDDGNRFAEDSLCALELELRGGFELSITEDTRVDCFVGACVGDDDIRFDTKSAVICASTRDPFVGGAIGQFSGLVHIYFGSEFPWHSAQQCTVVVSTNDPTTEAADMFRITGQVSCADPARAIGYPDVEISPFPFITSLSPFER